MPEKHFTHESANAALPLVRSIVTDLLDAGRRLRDAERRYAAAREQPLPSQVELNELNRETRGLEARCTGYVLELEDLGLRVEDADRGVVDFPSSLDRGPILLCWLYDEPRVEWYHREEDGFAGRQPVPVPVGV